MTTAHCPHCHQPLINTRLGVRLPPLKTAMFDLIRRSGDAGISWDEIARRLYGRPTSRKTINAHVWQINEMIEPAGYRIVSHRGVHPATFHLMKRADLVDGAACDTMRQ
jgi:hypothetical protein